MAERYVRELDADPGVDLDKLGAALELRYGKARGKAEEAAAVRGPI